MEHENRPTGAGESGGARRRSTQSTPQRRRKRRRKSLGIASAFTYVLFVIGVSLILSGCIVIFANDAFALVKEDQEITISVPEDASKQDVAKLLKEQGVIKYPFIFNVFAKFSGAEKPFNTGLTTLNSNMDYRAIISALQRKRTAEKVTVSVTIPEGYTNDQIIERLVEKKVCTEEELRDVIKNYDFDYDYIKALEKTENRLEGYLFPDTYDFYNASSEATVINKMLRRFDQLFTDEHRRLCAEMGYSVELVQAAEKNDMSIKDAVIIASLIEREAKLSSEQATISGVIQNRLSSKDYPKLQIDATIQYILGHKGALTNEDLKIDSPYNTYLYDGLPPGAIANPGLDALTAAVNPEKHDYYFYVAKPDGSHIFSKTYNEHLTAIEEAKRLAAEAEKAAS